MVDIKDGANYAPSSANATKVVQAGEFQFAVTGLDHGHINGQVNGLLDAGATLDSVYDPNPEKLAEFCQRFPQAKPVQSLEELLSRPNIQLVACAAIPDQRSTIGTRVLAAGKDFFTDKSPFTSLQQLQQIRAICKATQRKYMVYYAERLHNDAAWQAGELIRQGAIGRVLQVVNLAPHRLAKDTRPDWFFEKQHYGGILTDIGSHQVEQFLTYASCSEAEVNFARVCNFNNPDKPGLEDFGEMSLTGDNGASFYSRVDWFTPQGMPSWGDGRSFITGTEGCIEVRKYLDLARQAPASTLLLVDGTKEYEIDCSEQTGFPFFGQLILDVINRTEHAMSQEHAFKAAEISMRAQLIADTQNLA